MSGMKTLLHKIGSKVPTELSGAKDLFLSALVPRCVAWLSVDDERVSLLEGFSGAAYSPPSLYFAARALPTEVVARLRETKVCSISSATIRDPEEAFTKAGTPIGAEPQSFAFAELGLTPEKTKLDYPVVVEHAPIHMHCSVDKIVDLEEDGQALVILLVDIFVIDGSVLSEPTEEMKKRPNVTAKVDVQLIKPVVSLGQGKVFPLKTIHSMPRPVKQEDGTWTSTDFNLATPTPGPGSFATTEWIFKEHGATCPLGYNALTALIMPRPIGWISTYRKEGRVPHIAPYSFFSDVARAGDKPMVAFSGHRRNGESPKDAEQDAIDGGCFAFNMVTQSLAVPMNLSAAEIASEDSEFRLSGLQMQPAECIDAPVVVQSPIRFECKYIKSVPIGSFSIVVAEVVAIAINERLITGTDIDVKSLDFIMRLGFMDEYATIDI
eukprot:scaffold8501_cov165-Amphora_coffeaeformis.AAC.2